MFADRYLHYAAALQVSTAAPAASLSSTDHRAHLCITQQHNLSPALFFKLLSITTEKELLESRVAETGSQNDFNTADQNKWFVL